MRKIVNLKPHKMRPVVKFCILLFLFTSSLVGTKLAYSQGALITGVSATSGRTYTLGQLTVGTTIYTDRVYQVTSTPAFLNNAPMIKTSNDDKASTATSLLSFSLSQNATVYV